MEALELVADEAEPCGVCVDGGPGNAAQAPKPEVSVAGQVEEGLPSEQGGLLDLRPGEERPRGLAALLGNVLEPIDPIAPLEMPAECVDQFPASTLRASACRSPTIAAAHVTASRSGA